MRAKLTTKKLLAFIVALAAFSFVTQGQTKIKISGTVFDEAGNPIPGVAVIVEGTTNGTMTDLDGNYSINASSSAVLQFSCIGYLSMSDPVRGRAIININLLPDTTVLDEVVVVGYGTMKKSDLTGSISSISSKNLENFKDGSVMSAIGGQIAGVNVTATDGAPGTGFNVLVRGVGTVNGDSSPLYIVDGFEVENIDYLANQDIFSIEILKDASAAAIYGARAANGVVLVTTKGGKEGKTTVSYNGSVSYRVLSKHLDVMSPYDYVKLQDEFKSSIYYMSGNDENGEPYRFQTIDDYKNYDGIDWQNEAFRNTLSQNHDISISGGSKTSRFNGSFSHFDEDGIFVNSGYVKNTARLKVNRDLSKRVNVDLNVNYTSQNKYGMGTTNNVLYNIIGYRPTGGLRTSDEELRTSAYDPDDENSYNSHFNPVAGAYTTDASTKTSTWMGNGALTIKITDNLSFKTSGSYIQTNSRADNFYYSESQTAKKFGGAYGQSKMIQKIRYSNSNVLSYDRVIDKSHKINVMLGEEYAFQGTEFMTGQSKEFPLDFLGCDQLSIGTPSVVETSRMDKKRLSFFARTFYSYKKRYMLTATIRADGSSVFAESNRWGIFPSVAGAWTVSNEEWMKVCESWLDNLKIRFGWGTVGNDRITNYLTSDIYTTVKYGINSTSVTALIPKQLANPDLKWEGSTTINAGLDISVLKDHIKISADAFIKDTKDLLLAQDLALVSGFESQWKNAGNIRNKGLEISLNTINVNKKDFSWTTDFNISFIKNTLESLNDDKPYMLSRSGFDSNNTNYDYIAKVGESLGDMYGFVFDGIYQTSDFDVAGDGTMTLKKGVVNMDTHAGTAMVPGWVKYKDIDGDGEITDDDRTVIGNGYPKWYGGITNNFHIFGFDLSFLFQYSYGNDVFNVTRYITTKSNYEFRNMLAEVADRWTPENPSNTVPSTKGYTMHDIYSRFIEDGSYLRLKNVTLGYTLPVSLMNKAHISKARVYVTGSNLFCLTKYSGYDPEVSTSTSPLMPGLDNYAYPKCRIYTFGVELNF